MIKIKVAAIETIDRKFLAVFSHLSATRLKRLSFPIICSMRALPRYRAFANRLGMFRRFERYGMIATAPAAVANARFSSLS